MMEMGVVRLAPEGSKLMQMTLRLELYQPSLLRLPAPDLKVGRVGNPGL